MGTFTSREFNQETSRAKREARTGPVYVTDRGRPSHVLLTYEEYSRLTSSKTLVQALGYPKDVADVDVEFPRFNEVPAPPDLG